MNLYRLEVKLCGSAYIKAETEEEAVKLFHEHFGHDEKRWEGVDVDYMTSSRDFDDPRLPEVSLSPAMTALGPFTVAEDGSLPDLELVEQDIPESEDE